MELAEAEPGRFLALLLELEGVKKYLFAVVRLYVAFLLVFVLQKLLFLALNASYAGGIGLGDVLQVLWHGLRLDLVATSYLMIVPLLVMAVAMYTQRARLRGWLTWWFVPASVLVTLAFLADAVLYNFWGAKLDAADFVYAQNPKDIFASLSWGLVVLAFAALALLAFGQVVLLRWAVPKAMPELRHKWVGTVAVLLLLGVNFLGMRGGVQESTANPSYAYFSQKQFLNHAALNPAFNILHSMSKSEDLSREFAFYPSEELERLTAGVYNSYPDIADTLLATQRPNIVLLIWEGGGNLLTANDTIAPYFNRLKAEGVYFSNCYANNFRTDRGLVSLLNGWPGLPTTSVMKMSGRCRHLPSIAKHLGEEGYNSAFYYGGDIDFTNMRGYLFETGYDRVIGGENYAWAPNQGKWGADDQYLLTLAPNELPPSPFFATYLTLSSHEPWKVPYRRLAEDKANSFAYTDSCLYAFVQQLKQSGAWDSLLLIVVPDHGVEYGPRHTYSVEASRIPVLWLGGAVKTAKVVDKMMNQSDLAATLMAQLGIDGADFAFSRNVLSARYRPTLMMHAYKNGLNLIDTAGSTRFDLVDGQVLPAEPLHRPDATEEAKALLQLVYSRTAQL